MNDVITKHEITAQDTRALASADSISFHLTEGQGYIRAHRRGEHSSSGFDEYHTIFVDTRMQDYGDTDGLRTMGELTEYTAFHYEMSAKFDLVVQTLLRRIRVGDTLQLRWVASNNNNVNRDVGWHRDEVYLGIHHQKGKDEEYLLGVQVGPNNSARMVKRS